MKKKLFICTYTYLLLFISFHCYGQEPKITQYRIKLWLARGYTTVTIGTMSLYVDGVQYVVPSGNNPNTSIYYDNSGSSGSLPAANAISIVGNYSCWSQNTGTRNFTVNATIPNLEGCGGQLSHSNSAGQAGVTFYVDFIPIQIPTPSFKNTPGCLDDDIIWPVINHHNNKVAGNTSSGSSNYTLEMGIYNGTSTPSNVRTVANITAFSSTVINEDIRINLETVLGANASQYISQQVIFRAWREGTSTPCADYFDKVYSGWTAPYTIYPPGPKMSSSITSTPPHCWKRPSTATLTVPPINGTTSSYVYSVTKLVPVNTGSECASEIQIEHNGKKYCPGTSTINRTASGANSETFANLTSGVYQVIVENQGLSNSCPRFTTHEIGEPLSYTVSASPNATHSSGYHIVCHGGTTGQITFTVNGGTSPYTYYVNETTRSLDVANPPTVSNLPAGTYTLRVTDSNGCETDVATNDVTLTETPVNQAFKASANDIVDPKCNGEPSGYVSLLLENGSGPFSFALNGSSVSASGVEQSPVIGGLSANTAYTISVTDGNNCSSQLSAPITLGQPNAITYTHVDPINLTCNNIPSGKITVTGATGGTGALQYSINGGSNYQPSAIFTGLPAGMYTVRIKDANECFTNTTAAEVTQPTAITFSSITTFAQSCPEIVDGAISLAPSSGGTGAKKYSIDGTTYVSESSTILFPSLSSANYTLFAKDEANCVVTTTSFLAVKPPVAATIVEANPISCYGDSDGALQLTPSGGTAPYTFTWSNNQLTKDITGLNDGSYTVTVNDSKGCKKDFSYELKQPEVLALQSLVSNYNGSGVTCKGFADGYIDLSVAGGTAPFTFLWSTNATTEDINSLTSGNYAVDVVDAHGCKTSLNNVMVTEPTFVTAAIDKLKNISCKDGADGEIEVLASGGVSLYKYSLNNTAWQDEPIFTGLKALDHTIFVRDGNGCEAQVVQSLTEPTLLALTLLEKIETSCGEANGSAKVEASGGAGSYLYTWYDEGNSQISSTDEAGSLFSGDYKAYVHDANGCVKDLAIIINDSNGPKVEQQSLIGLTCHDSNDGSIAVTVNSGLPPYDIEWDTSEKDVTAVNNLSGGEHFIVVKDANGCRIKKVYNVPFPPALQLTAITSDPICTGQSNGKIEISATGGNPGAYSYLWASGETKTILTDLNAATYRVTVTDTKQCSLAQEITLTDPPLFIVDAGGDRTICVGQKLNVSAQEDNATYAWTSDAGFSSNEREVTLTLPARYTLKVVSEKGCEAEDSFNLNTSNALLQADFLSAPEAFAGDTVVLIEISWPIPERIEWTFPTEAVVLNEYDAYAEIIFKAPGVYDILLNTFLGECIDELHRSITILEERIASGGRTSNHIVKSFTVHPNPNDGKFTVTVELNEIKEGSLTMFSLSGNSTLIDLSFAGKTEISYDAILENLPSGLYFLVLQVGDEKLTKRIIIY